MVKRHSRHRVSFLGAVALALLATAIMPASSALAGFRMGKTERQKKLEETPEWKRWKQQYDQVLLLIDNRDYKAAESEAIELHEYTKSAKTPLDAAALDSRSVANALSQANFHLGRYSEAGRWLALASRDFDPASADMYSAAGEFAKAEAMLLRSVDEATRGILTEDKLKERGCGEIVLADFPAYDAAENCEYLKSLADDQRTVIFWYQDYVLGYWRNLLEALDAKQKLASLYVGEGRIDEAEPLLVEVLRGRSRRLGPDHNDSIETAHELGVVQLAKGNYAEAALLLRRGLRAGSPVSLEARHNLALALYNLGSHTQAEKLLLEALTMSTSLLGEDHTQTHYTRGRLAQVYQAQGRLADADRTYTQSLRGLKMSLGPEHPKTIAIAAEFSAMRLMSEEQRSKALEPARILLDGLAARAAMSGGAAHGAAQREREQKTYSSAFLTVADAAWEARSGGAEDERLGMEAFAALQQATQSPANAAVLRNAAKNSARSKSADLLPIVEERERLSDHWRDLRKLYRSTLEGSSEAGDAGTVKARLDEAEAALKKVDQLLLKAFPAYFDLTTPRSVQIGEAQKILLPDEAILFVVPTPRGTQLVAISQRNVVWKRSTWSRTRVDETVRRLLWNVGGNVEADAVEEGRWQEEAGEGYAFDRKTAHALHQELIAPVQELLTGKRHVFIAGAGSLASLPFGLLVTEEPQGSDGDPGALRNTKWFADAHALVQIPSIQSLRFLRAQPRSPPAAGSRLAFVGIGDPVLAGTSTQRGRARGATPSASAVFSQVRSTSGAALADVEKLRTLARLPGTATELENLRNALGASPEEVFLGDRATEATIRKLDLSQTRILAFATHGLMAGELDDSTEPGLVLTPPSKPSEADDGLLTASEVSAMRLNADWVILSACNTAAGDGSEGAQGLSGLAKAFFYAGARNLLASHWPVRDDVASIVTVRAMQLMKERPVISRAEALQLAMREIRSNKAHDSVDDTWAHPNAWAPFTLIGDAGR